MHMINLVTRIAPVILVILFIQSSRGQENFIPGYLVRLNGDTLRGFEVAVDMTLAARGQGTGAA